MSQCKTRARRSWSRHQRPFWSITIGNTNGRPDRVVRYGKRRKPEPLGPINRVLGAIPYSLVCQTGIELQRRDGYRLTRESFYIRAELDWIWKFRNPRAPWIHRVRKIGSFVNWSAAEGWWIEDGKTGRKTRTMPKFLAAVLGVTLISFSPEMLQITFTHAETAQRPEIVYGVLCLVVFLLVSLIAFYLWVGHRSRPSGIEQILKQLGKSLGNNKDGETSNQSSGVLEGNQNGPACCRMEVREPNR